MKFLRPTREQIDAHIDIPIDAIGLNPPTYEKDEWHKSHRQFVLHVLLPQVRPPHKVWKICAEAYLTDLLFEEDHPTLNIKTGDIKTFEQVLSDGSSVVPDLAYRWGNIKDPWAMGHDLIYILNRLKWKDVYDHSWTLIEAHKMYKNGWIAQGNNLIGNIWYVGLVLGGWTFWLKKFKNKPEKITGWEFKKGISCTPFDIAHKQCC